MRTKQDLQLSRDGDIIRSFEEEVTQGADMNNKELFSNEDVETKTELELPEIRSIIKAKMIMKMLNNDFIDFKEITNDYMTLKISHKRKSREEFIRSFGAERREENLGRINLTR